MSINKILNSLEKSWERDDILIKIKNGLGTDEIVNEFLEKNEVQIFSTVMSSDKTQNPDIAAMIGASAALTISGVPFDGPMGAARVGFIDG